MFREMRRKDKQMSAEECNEILNTTEIGILSTICENGYPYGVPLNYVYFNGCVYFHSATSGQKLDNINLNSKVSFCITCDVELLSDKFDTNYRSVVFFGNASEVNENEKAEALLEFIKKYSGAYIEQGKEYINKAKGAAKVYKIDVEHMTGKAQK